MQQETILNCARQIQELKESNHELIRRNQELVQKQTELESRRCCIFEYVVRIQNVEECGLSKPLFDEISEKE